MPTLRKRGNSFEITVSVGYDINGRQIRKYATFTPPEGVTPKKAEKLAHAFAMDFEKKCQGSLDLNENMKFEDLVEWYFEQTSAFSIWKQKAKRVQFGNVDAVLQ